MLGTDFRTGSPNWLDLGTPDIAAAAAFHHAVFGWEFVSAGPNTGDYGFFRIGDRTVAAMGPLTEEGARSAWTVHFRTDDIEATVEAVRAGGGRVRMEPGDVMGEGWLAQLTDPQGAEFAVWQPGRTRGFDLASAENTLLWVELHVPDPAEALRFYGILFGWRSQVMEVPGMTYRVLSVAEGDIEDASFGGVAPLGPESAEEGGAESGGRARWVPYFCTADADAAASRVREAGGSVLMEPADVPEVGRIAWLADPAGAVFAVLRPEPRRAG
ncbi:VOC family protein [Streptomyces sp. BI20]|uniref:VOC family protein n=1 Tax=Streptomyces sp. BI20 TaxID=3403460 RepID=UPI003C777142